MAPRQVPNLQHPFLMNIGKGGIHFYFYIVTRKITKPLGCIIPKKKKQETV